ALHEQAARLLLWADCGPPRPPTVPPWDLALVLEALARHPFEPLRTPLLIVRCVQGGLCALTLSNPLYALEGAPKGGPSPNSSFRIG
ncbi:hypothetical protein M9458_039616, partial [Cirrhinus mrigala]